MKTPILFALFALFFGTAHAASLDVTINDVNVPSGKLMIKLVDNAASYDDQGKPVAGHALDISSKGNVKVTFADLKPGSYAILVMHDENSNGKLDSNILGIPKEGYGFSNNPRVMRKPTFEEARFEVKEGDNVVAIDLI